MIKFTSRRCDSKNNENSNEILLYVGIFCKLFNFLIIFRLSKEISQWFDAGY